MNEQAYDESAKAKQDGQQHEQTEDLQPAHPLVWNRARRRGKAASSRTWPGALAAVVGRPARRIGKNLVGAVDRRHLLGGQTFQGIALVFVGMVLRHPCMVGGANLAVGGVAGNAENGI